MQFMSLLYNSVEVELHAMSKLATALHSDVRRWCLGLDVPLELLEFFDSIHQRLVNFVVPRVRV